MAERRNPTNSDLLKGINEVKAVQKTQDGRIGALELWKVSEDAYRAALAKVKREEEESQYTRLRDGELRKRTEVFKQIGIIAGIIIAILYAYSATHGIR